VTDPLEGSPWSRPETVAGFVASPPNPTLMEFARGEIRSRRVAQALDVGCGAGRNAIPLAADGWKVLGTDLSLPMVAAATRRAAEAGLSARFHALLAPMDRLPVASRSCDLVVAHGIWNLARSGAEFHRAVRESARVARQDAALFVFTFSRNTLAPQAQPVRGESFVFTDFSGDSQCFLTEDQLLAELAAANWTPDASVPLRELNRPSDGALRARGVPVIYEGVFRYCGLRGTD
jgi:SAM-dependent methyltransferase